MRHADLITSLVCAHKRVICFPIREYWLDVGQMFVESRVSTLRRDVAE